VGDLPLYPEQSRTGDAGVYLVAWQVNRDLGWVVRKQSENDFGIDAHIEVVQGGLATGRILAAQIKAGPSWFAEPANGGWWYRGDANHLNYWIEHSLPVILILCDLTAETCYWVGVRGDNVQRLKSGWKIVVPDSQRLTADAKSALAEIARRQPLALDAALRSFLLDKYGARIEIASIMESPRDYHWFEELAEVEGEIVSVACLDLTRESCDATFFEECRRWRDWNARNACTVDKIHVYVISPEAVTLPPAARLKELAGDDGLIETFRLASLDQELAEIDDEGFTLMWFPRGNYSMQGHRLRED
jgi:hypothetical protein